MLEDVRHWDMNIVVYIDHSELVFAEFLNLMLVVVSGYIYVQSLEF